MIDEIWALLNKLPSDAYQTALSKCKELGVDPDSGIVTLDESYTNLSWSCNTLKGAIEQKKLIQLPITIQSELRETLKAIVANHEALIAGSNVVDALTRVIEKLFTEIWRSGLNNLTDEQLGYLMKLNQLKEIESSIIATKAILEDGIAKKDALEILFADSKQKNNEQQAFLTTADAAVIKVNDNLTAITNSNEKASKTLEVILETQTKSAALLKATNDNNEVIETHEKVIRGLVAEFTTLNSELVASKEKQAELFAAFEGYRNKIDGLLGDANRTGMAASFTSRRKWLIAPLSGWLVLFGGSIAGLVFMGVTYIAPLLDPKNTFEWQQLPLRLALTAPFIWLGWFSARQHGFTSRLREDYAYKEASAKSFEGYKREAKDVDPEMLKKLLEQAIRNLGDNPIRIYSGHNNHPSPTHELLDNIMKDDKSLSRFKEFFSIFKS